MLKYFGGDFPTYIQNNSWLCAEKNFFFFSFFLFFFTDAGMLRDSCVLISTLLWAAKAVIVLDNSSSASEMISTVSYSKKCAEVINFKLTFMQTEQGWTRFCPPGRKRCAAHVLKLTRCPCKWSLLWQWRTRLESCGSSQRDGAELSWKQLKLT